MANRSVRHLAVLLTIVGLTGWLHGRVGSIAFSTLVKDSDEIVLGRVVDVITVKDAKIARVKVLETYKGEKVDELFFFAQPTWVCDISEAVKNETILLFLRHYSDKREGLEKMFLPSLPSPQALEAAGVGKAMFLIVDNGRGRMPLRMIGGQRYATVWIDDVRLPPSVHTLGGPKTRSTFIRSVLLNDIVGLVQGSVASIDRSAQQR